MKVFIKRSAVRDARPTLYASLAVAQAHNPEATEKDFVQTAYIGPEGSVITAPPADTDSTTTTTEPQPTPKAKCSQRKK